MSIEKLSIDIIKQEIIDKTKLGNIKDFYDLGFNDTMFVALYPEEKGSEWIFKLDFLSKNIAGNYSKSMFSQYITLFKKIKNIEGYYGRDVSDFTAEEMLALLKTFRAKSYNSVSNKYSLLKNYINYAKTNKVGEVTAPTGLLLQVDDLKEAIAEFKRDSAHCTRTELEDALTKHIPNPNDKVVYALLFEGVSGDKYEDLLTLRDSDLDLENNRLTTPSGKVVTYSNFTKKILMDCAKQTEGLMLDGTRKYQIDTTSPYVVKCKLTETSNGEPMKYAGLSRKLAAVKKKMELSFITGNAVYSSGVLERISLYQHNVLERKIETGDIIEFIEANNEDIDKNGIVRLLNVIGDTYDKDLEKRNWKIV